MVMEKNDQKEEVKINEDVVAENTEDTAETLSDAASQTDSQILKLQNEIGEQKDKYIRLYSEFENFRRRTSKEKLEMIQSANEQLIKALLPVVDDFERAVYRPLVDLTASEDLYPAEYRVQRRSKFVRHIGVEVGQLLVRLLEAIERAIEGEDQALQLGRQTICR